MESISIHSIKGDANGISIPKAEEAVDGDSYWASLPPELLREILARIEESELAWPKRRHVVACAGVCRTWRVTMKEIVGAPEVSGRLTFPISVNQPGPRDSMIQCFIKRDRSRQSYLLFLGLTEDDGKFLLAARRIRRPSYSDFVISLDADVLKERGSYVGKLRSNFLGTKYTVYDAQPHTGAMIMKSHSFRLGCRQASPRVPTGDCRVTHIAYELNLLGSRGPRRMNCVMNSVPASAFERRGMTPTQTELPLGSVDSLSSVPFFRSMSFNPDNLSGHLIGPKEGMLVLKNKDPRWHDQLQCWCLNFGGRVSVASVKNFQLVAASENGQVGADQEKVLLQFGKTGKDLFTMDYQYPLSAFQAFAICLSSFDTKVASE